MRIIKSIAILLISLFSTQLLSAQKKPARKPVIIPVQKFKAPTLQTQLDTYKDSVGISTNEAIRIIALPLKIYDDKKNEYAISSYQFLYKKRVVSEDEDGKAIPASSITSQRFLVSPLPQLWLNLIREDVKSGEEFYFFDVIAKDAKGRVMYASNLKISIR